jgi:subtilisin family serine protease
VLTGFGDGDDMTVGEGIERLRKDVPGVDVLNLSLSGYTDDDEPPMVIAEALARLAGLPNHPVVVAAAGNAGSSRPAYPAALGEVIAVAATTDVERAWFSNYGPWVDACAPGVDVISTFFVGFPTPLQGYDEPDPFKSGWASWSGTSFSAPKVAAAIARHMTDHGVSAQDAADAIVRRWGLIRIPDLGVVVNLL